jgi:hypothetical protein
VRVIRRRLIVAGDPGTVSHSAHPGRHPPGRGRKGGTQTRPITASISWPVVARRPASELRPVVGVEWRKAHQLTALPASPPFLAANPRGSGVYHPPVLIVINTNPFFDYQACKRTPGCARLLSPVREPRRPFAVGRYLTLQKAKFLPADSAESLDPFRHFHQEESPPIPTPAQAS